MRYVLAFLLVLLAAPGVAAVDFYEMHWIALCGSDKFDNPGTDAAVYSGTMRIAVEEVTDPDGTFWTARMADSQIPVWGYADTTTVQDLDLSTVAPCGDHIHGSFQWNPGGVGAEDWRKSFAIDRASVLRAGMRSYFVAGGVRVPPPVVEPPPSPSEVKISLTPNQTVRRSVPVDVTATGFWTGDAGKAPESLRLEMSVVAGSSVVQSWLWLKKPPAAGQPVVARQWWQTAGAPVGTVKFRVKATDLKGNTVTAEVPVVVAR